MSIWFCSFLTGFFWLSSVSSLYMWILTPYSIHGLQKFSAILCGFFSFDLFLLLWRRFQFNIVTFVDFCFYCLCVWCLVQKNSSPRPTWMSSSRHLLLGILWYQFLCLSLWSSISWFGRVGRIRVQFHCSAWEIPSFASTMCWRNCPLFIGYSWFPCQILVDP